MKFEYNPAKSLANKSKHGLDFEEAKALWDDENLHRASGRQALDSNHDLPWYDGADNFCPPLTERGDKSL